MSEAADNAAPSVEDQIKTAVDAAVAATVADKDAVIERLHVDFADLEDDFKKLAAEVRGGAKVLTSDVFKVLAAYEHDVIGKAHFLFNDIKALVTSAQDAE